MEGMGPPRGGALVWLAPWAGGGRAIGRRTARIKDLTRNFSDCNIGPCVDTYSMRGDMADVIEFSGRSTAAVETGKGYRAFATTDMPGRNLFLVFRDPNRYLILRYTELESIAPVPGIASNRAVMLRFGGSVVRDVRIDGRRLLDLVRYLRWHQVAYIEETPWKWDNRDDGVVSVTHITVKEVRR